MLSYNNRATDPKFESYSFTPCAVTHTCTSFSRALLVPTNAATFRSQNSASCHRDSQSPRNEALFRSPAGLRGRRPRPVPWLSAYFHLCGPTCTHGEPELKWTTSVQLWAASKTVPSILGQP